MVTGTVVTQDCTRPLTATEQRFWDRHADRIIALRK